MDSSKIAVNIEGLWKRYGKTKALRGVNCNFPAGKICGLIGPNSSGKTTLLKSIIGLVKPDQGSIRVFDSPLSRKHKEKIAFLPENNHLYRSMAISQLVRLHAALFTSFSTQNAYHLLNFVGLEPKQKIEELSKGMTARLKLVLALAREVPLVILDEPLAGIDLNSRAKILEGMISTYDPSVQTVILSTHEVGEAERYLDYIVFLEEGNTKLAGAADDLRATYGKSIHDLTKEVFG